MKKLQIHHGHQQQRIRQLNAGEEPRARKEKYVLNDNQIEERKGRFVQEWAAVDYLPNPIESLVETCLTYLDYMQHRLGEK